MNQGGIKEGGIMGRVGRERNCCSNFSLEGLPRLGFAKKLQFFLRNNFFAKTKKL